jgi:hypothetical protein
MTRARFDCIFDQLDPALRDKRWQGNYIERKLESFRIQREAPD